DLHLDRHAEVITELHGLAYAHPLREQMHGLLMLAQSRCGRQGAALAAYQHARRVLVEELGTEPGADLQALHQQILNADHGLAARPPPRKPSASCSTALRYPLIGSRPACSPRSAFTAACWPAVAC